MSQQIIKKEGYRYILMLYDQQMSYYAIKELKRLIKQLRKTDVLLLIKRKRTDDCIIHLAIENKNNLLVFTTNKTSDNIQDVIKYLFERSPRSTLIISESDTQSKNRLLELVDCLIVIELFNDQWTLDFMDDAINKNIEVYSLVHPANSHAINNRLIQAGAYLIENMNDLILKTGVIK